MAQNQCKRIKKPSSLITSCFDVLLCAVHSTGLVNYIKFYNFGQFHQLTSLMSATQGPQAEAIQPFLSPLRSQDT